MNLLLAFRRLRLSALQSALSRKRRSSMVQSPLLRDALEDQDLFVLAAEIGGPFALDLFHLTVEALGTGRPDGDGQRVAVQLVDAQSRPLLALLFFRGDQVDVLGFLG